MVGSWMDYQVGGFVDYQDVFVFVDDFQFDVLCELFVLGFLFGFQDQLCIVVDDVVWVQYGVVDGQVFVFDLVGQMGVGVFGKKLGGDLVEMLVIQFEWYFGCVLNYIGYEQEMMFSVVFGIGYVLWLNMGFLFQGVFGVLIIIDG